MPASGEATPGPSLLWGPGPWAQQPTQHRNVGARDTLSRPAPCDALHRLVWPAATYGGVLGKAQPPLPVNESLLPSPDHTCSQGHEDPVGGDSEWDIGH